MDMTYEQIKMNLKKPLTAFSKIAGPRPHNVLDRAFSRTEPAEFDEFRWSVEYAAYMYLQEESQEEIDGSSCTCTFNLQLANAVADRVVAAIDVYAMAPWRSLKSMVDLASSVAIGRFVATGANIQDTLAGLKAAEVYFPYEAALIQNIRREVELTHDKSCIKPMLADLELPLPPFQAFVDAVQARDDASEFGGVIPQGWWWS